MSLTIAELASAVERSETYVRQHIHRKHLAVRRVGRRVYVEVSEARRWALERGLSFTPSTSSSALLEPLRDRTARMTVLAWHAPDGRIRNLFTLLRHRRRDALGPWASEAKGIWSVDDLADQLRLYSFDAPQSFCEPLIGGILDSGRMEVEGSIIRYALEPVPRRHWAYRDRREIGDDPLQSPFAKHSAAIREYWSFAAEPRDFWQQILESQRPVPPSWFARLGFPLDHRSDRIGNLMIASAADEIACDLVARQNGVLTLLSQDDVSPRAYRGVVWASHSGDIVLHREVPISGEATSVRVSTDIDRVGFAVYRNADGQCVDLMDEHLIMEVQGHLNLEAGPTLRLRSRKGRRVTHEVNPFRHTAPISVLADEGSAELDKGIRWQSLDHAVHKRESAARRTGDLIRFKPGMWKEATRHVLSILAQDCEPSESIYLADPYFMHALNQSWDMRQFCIDMFAATGSAPLRILCGAKGDGLPRWWSAFPKAVSSHVSVRRFFQVDAKGRKSDAFHDRFLITPKREILITHSINGWDSSGVTFVSLTYGVYRAEAEQFWQMGTGSATASVVVKEVT